MDREKKKDYFSKNNSYALSLCCKAWVLSKAMISTK